MSNEQELRSQVLAFLTQVVKTSVIPERATDPFSSSERHYLRAGASLGDLGLALYAEESPDDVARAAINVAYAALAVASTTAIASLLAEQEIRATGQWEEDDFDDMPF